MNVVIDPRVRRGRSSDRLGKDQERRIERVYGPVKVGEFGRAIDLIGQDFMWQSKASRLPAPKTYPAAGIWPTPTRDYITRNINAMTALRSDLMPLLILSWVRHGVRPVDVIYVYWGDWYRLHGELVVEPSQFIAMTGAHFLDTHGRDAPTIDPLIGLGGGRR